MSPRRRSPTRTPLRSKGFGVAEGVARVALPALLFVLLWVSGGRAQTQGDLQVDALSPTVLVTFSPVSLADPVRQRRARAIADYEQGMFAGWALAPIAAFLYLWQSGNAARLRDALRRRFRARWIVRFVFGAFLGALATAAALPFAFAAYRIAASVGLTRQPIPSWFFDQIVRLGAVALCSAVAVAIVLELVDRTRLWYLVFIGLLYIVVLATVAVEPVLLSPLASHHRPAPAGIVALGEGVARAIGATPVSIEITTDASRSGSVAARTSGLGPFTRILLDNDALARMTSPERAWVLAEQYAHVRRRDVLVLALWGTTLFVVAAALAVLVSDRIGFRRDDDPLVRLALVGTCLGVTVLALLPAYNAIQRRIESQTDRLALQATRDPAAAARFFIRSANDSLIPICGRRTTRWYFDTRDPLGARVAAVTGESDPCPR